MSKSRRSTGRQATVDQERGLVFADVILHSRSGKSVFEAANGLSPKTVEQYLPAERTLGAARAELERLGFEIDLVAPTHITAIGRKEQFEEVFQVKLLEKTAPYFQRRQKASQEGAQQTYHRAHNRPTIPATLEKLVEAIEFPGPITYYVSATPPPLAYDHLEVPQDVARDMDALKAQERGITGAGINLVMVDSGFMTPLHPYYVGKGYNIQPLVPDPADPNPNVDGVGHGTGISACALAVAPGATYTVYKIYSTAFAAAFARAAMAAPNIITCSWGVPFSAALQLSINNAVAAGTVVCFACGNGGSVGWPGSEPAVISVGGAFVASNDSLQASSYASSGTNPNNPGRQTPDLCGIVGMAPAGIFIALPTQPSSTFDNQFSGGSYPNNDTTAPDDGWLVASGTSSATPMVAASAALLMEANPAAVGNPATVRSALVASCVDVSAGARAAGPAAASGPDLATGAGLVSAYRAVNGTDLWMRDNPDSDVGLVPTHNRRPAWPPFAHWVSPDIKVFSATLASPDADFDPTPAESPIFGQDNYVYVRVRNRGLQTSGLTTVSLYYADPATSLIFPSDWKDGQSGVAAEGGLAVGGAGSNQQSFPAVAPGAANVLPDPFVWRPPDPTNATQSQVLPDGRTVGHFCLLTRLESADDPIIFAGGGQTSVVEDNNIGMANQEIYSAPPGGMFFFPFYVRGGTRKQGKTKNDLLFDLRHLPSRAEVTLELAEVPKDLRLLNAKRTKTGIRLLVGQEPAGLLNLALAPNQRALARLGVEFSSRVRPRDYPISVVQRSGGHDLGGMNLIARVRRR
jgi:hypothetical protein